MTVQRIQYILAGVVVLLAALIVFPSFSIKFGDVEVNVPDVNLNDLCIGGTGEIDEEGVEDKGVCLYGGEYGFKNSRDFTSQRLVRYELTGTEEENRVSIQSIRDRLEILGLRDYLVRSIEDEETIQIEFLVPESEQQALQSIRSVVASGDVILYQDDEDYVADSNEIEIENNALNFLQGKKPAATINVNDIKTVRHYFEPALAGGAGGFVLDVDFGNDLLDNVMRAAEPTYFAQGPVPGMMLVQNGFPIAVQAAPIEPANPAFNYEGQSNILFTSFFPTQDGLVTKAIGSLLNTNPITSEIILVDEFTIAAETTPNSVNMLKAGTLSVFVLIAIAAIALFKKQERLAILSSLVLTTVMVAFIKLLNIFELTFDSTILLGIILMFGLTLVTLATRATNNLMPGKHDRFMFKAAIAFFLAVSVTLAGNVNEGIREVVLLFGIFSLTMFALSNYVVSLLGKLLNIK